MNAIYAVVVYRSLKRKVKAREQPWTLPYQWQTVRYFLNDRQRGQRRLKALRRMGQVVDQAGLYERVLVSSLAESEGHGGTSLRLCGFAALRDTVLALSRVDLFELKVAAVGPCDPKLLIRLLGKKGVAQSRQDAKKPHFG